MKVNSIKTGTIWSILGQFASLIFGFLVLVLTTRFLGPETYGLLQTILTLIVLTVMVADLGFSSSVSRYVAENQFNSNNKSQYIFTGLILKLISSILIIILLINTFPFLENLLGVELEKYTMLLIVLTLLRSFKEFLLRILQGIRRFDISTKLNLFYNFGNTLLVAIFLLIGFEISAILLSEIVITIFFIAIYFYLNKRLQMFSYSKFNIRLLKRLLYYAVPMFLISMSFYLYMKTDILMVQYYLDSMAVGFYSLATMVIAKVHLPMVAIGQATGPALVSLEMDRRASQLVKIIQVTFLITLPMCVGLFLVSKDFVIVLFGESYSPTIQLLQLMTIFLFFYSMNSVLSPILDYLGYAKKRAVMVGISASLNVFLNIIFIPNYGIMGAAYSTLITYSVYSLVIVSTVFKYVIREKKYYQEIIKTFIKISLITLIMGTLVFINQLFFEVGLLNFVLSILLGIVSYLFLIFKYNLISKKELLSLIKK